MRENEKNGNDTSDSFDESERDSKWEIIQKYCRINIKNCIGTGILIGGVLGVSGGAITAFHQSSKNSFETTSNTLQTISPTEKCIKKLTSNFKSRVLFIRAQNERLYNNPKKTISHQNPDFNNNNFKINPEINIQINSQCNQDPNTSRSTIAKTIDHILVPNKDKSKFKKIKKVNTPFRPQEYKPQNTQYPQENPYLEFQEQPINYYSRY